MQTDIDVKRELARAYWRNEKALCPKHGVAMTAEFIQSNYFDQLVFGCPRGDTFTIPQRPKQVEFNVHQLEGFVVFLQSGDNILCYRCQRRLQVETTENVETGVTDFSFTCTHCFSWGTWSGRPEEANVVGVSDRT